MGDQMETTAVIDQAVETELTRVVRAAENGQTYRGDTLRVYGYKILREAFPDKVNRESWRAMSGREPDARFDPEERARREREAQQRADAEQAQARIDRDFLRQHGRGTCCPDCDRQNAANLRRELAQAAPAQAPADPPDTEEEEDEPGCEHQGVECRECSGTGCGGFDRWGDPQDCETNCPSCELCEESHPCRNCGLDPHCDHSWHCDDCAEDVEWQRDHWEIS
jgi:hypothetical protein